MTQFWIAVVSKEHVQLGVAGGFAQVCHGKAGPLKQMSEGDWILYYSPTLRFQTKEPCRSFTAIGKVGAGDPYPFAMSESFHPWRKNVSFFPCKEIPIELLIEKLSFIKDKKIWGFPFKRGCFQIDRNDFQIISQAMGVFINEQENQF